MRKKESWGDTAVIEYGEVQLDVKVRGLRVPRYGIDLESLPVEVLVWLINEVDTGNPDPALIEVLSRISKLNASYRNEPLRMLAKGVGPNQLLKALPPLEHLDREGWLHEQNCLLVKRDEAGNCILVRFLSEFSADCALVFANRVPETVFSGLSSYSLCLSPDITRMGAAALKRAAAEVDLPRRVVEVLELASYYDAHHIQVDIFEKLKKGAFGQDAEFQSLKTAVERLRKEKERIEKYWDAQRTTFLEKTGELLLPGLKLVLRLRDPVEVYKVESECGYEFGRYIVRGKWGTGAKLVPYVPTLESREAIVSACRPLLGSLPEPYRERLSTFLVGLSLE